MRKYRILYLLLIFPFMLFAQNREISGTVLDENKQPLPGASVLVKNASLGASTDFDGKFTLTINENTKTLLVSYLGYKTKEVSLTNENSYLISLEVDSNTLEEVVIVGYGTLQRKDITGSISKIKEKSEVSGQYTSASSMLQGRTAGVQVTSNGGSPGSPASVRIRGTNSLRGNNEPLYVIDGVIINSAGEDVLNATADANEKQQTQNGLTGLNLRDVESMQILKDASATAIYGSRGANGVVLITTKRGKQGKGVLNLYSTTAVSQVTKTIDIMSPVNYAQYRNQDAIINENNIPYQIVGNDVYLIDNGVVGDKPLRQVNWQNDILRLTNSSSVGGNVSGAFEKSDYYLSGEFNQQEGVVPNTFLNSGNFRINYNTRVSDKVKLDTRIGFYIGRGTMSQGSSVSGGDRSFVRQLISYNPLVDGELENDEIGDTNPYTFLDGYAENIKGCFCNSNLWIERSQWCCVDYNQTR